MTQDRFVHRESGCLFMGVSKQLCSKGFKNVFLGTLDISVLRDVGHEESPSRVTNLFKGT